MPVIVADDDAPIVANPAGSVSVPDQRVILYDCDNRPLTRKAGF